MATVTLNTSATGTALMNIMMAEDIQPGAAPSYQTCKLIYTMHPLGLKMALSPVKMAQSQPREISVPAGPEERVKEAFEREWKSIAADRLIRNCAGLARAYGIASIAVLTKGESPDKPFDLATDALKDLTINVLDPLNTAGSLVLNQDPNSTEFQKAGPIAVAGKQYDGSRSVTIMNEEPVYIEYTTSAFGFVGRSVYQRALFPLKTYLQTLLTDDLVVVKSGVLVVALKQVGAIVNAIAQQFAGLKRIFVKEAVTGNVISIGAPDERIETLNMQNLDGAYGMARKNVLENIALAADMPAKLLNAESFAEGFGEGTEDAKHVAEYIRGIREWLEPLYTFFDRLVMRRAWTPEFYKTIQADFSEQWGNRTYNEAFYDWSNSFRAQWPNLLEEPESEKVKVDDVKLKAIIAMVQVMAPMIDPENRVALLQWASDNFNALKMMFTDPLVLDWDTLADYLEEQAEQQKAMAEAGAAAADEEGGPQEPPTPKPFSASDSAAIDRAVADFSAATRAIADGRSPRRRARHLERLGA